MITLPKSFFPEYAVTDIGSNSTIETFSTNIDNKKYFVKPSMVDAFSNFLLAANENSPEGMYYVGLCMIHGIGCDINPDRGVEYLEKSYNLDFPFSAFEYSRCLVSGLGCVRDPVEAIEILKSIAASNSPYSSKAMFQIAELYRTGRYSLETNEGDIQRSSHWMKLASLKGVPEAQYAYAKMLKNREIEPHSEFTNVTIESRFPNSKSSKRSVNDIVHHLLTMSSNSGYGPSYLALAFIYSRSSDSTKYPNPTILSKSKTGTKNIPNPSLSVPLYYLYQAAIHECPEAQYLFSIYLSAKLNFRLESLLPNNGIHPGESTYKQYHPNHCNQPSLNPMTPIPAKLDISTTLLISNWPKQHDDPLYWLTQSASKDYGLAQFALGCEYYRIAISDNSIKFWDLAIKMFTKAAGHMNDDANYFLGLIHENGHGNVPIDTKQAVKYYSIGAMNGHPACQFKLASCTERGYTIGSNENSILSSNINRTVMFYTRAARQGHPEAQYNLGMYYYNKISDSTESAVEETSQSEGTTFLEKSIYFLTLAAKNGIDEAMYTLGYVSLKDPNLTLRDSMEWFSKAADAGNSKALYTMGLLHSRGAIISDSDIHKIPQVSQVSSEANVIDIPLAMKYFTLAARKGHPEAQYAVSVALEKGICSLKDPVKSLDWCKQAAEQGHSLAAMTMGNHYLQLHSSESELTASESLLNTAQLWYEKAIPRASSEILPSAEFSLAICYELQNDWTNAVVWATKAAFQHNFAPAQVWLSERYSRKYGDQGVEYNPQKALEWAQKASTKSPTGKSHLASLLLNLETSKLNDDNPVLNSNSIEAFRLFKSSVEEIESNQHPFDPSCFVGLGNCYFNGIGTSVDYSQALKCYEIAASKTGSDLFPPAHYHLGFCYCMGLGLGSKGSVNGVTVDHIYEGYLHYKIAAKHGFAPAQFNLAALLERHETSVSMVNATSTESNDKWSKIPFDIQGAMYWYFKAAEQDHPRALSRFKTLQKTNPEE